MWTIVEEKQFKFFSSQISFFFTKKKILHLNSTAVINWQIVKIAHPYQDLEENVS